jgi:hypothetical protein
MRSSSTARQSTGNRLAARLRHGNATIAGPGHERGVEDRDGSLN